MDRTASDSSRTPTPLSSKQRFCEKMFCTTHTQSRREFHRSRQKVDVVSWNPVFIDVFALVLAKDTIVLKRKGQVQPCWKVCVEHLFLPFAQKTPPIEIKCLVWSPNGEILSAISTDCTVFLFSFELGTLLYHWNYGNDDPKDNVLHAKWQDTWSKPNVLEDSNEDSHTAIWMNFLETFSISFDPKTDDKNILRVSATLQEAYSLMSKLDETALMILFDDNSVLVLLGGIFPVVRIEPPSSFYDLFEHVLLRVFDFELIHNSTDEPEADLQLVFACMSGGRRPEFPATTGFGALSAEELKNLKPSKNGEMEPFSHLLAVDLAISKLPRISVRKMVHEFTQTAIAFTCLVDALSAFAGNWCHELDLLARRLNECSSEKRNVPFGMLFLFYLYCGPHRQITETFENKLGNNAVVEFRDALEGPISRALYHVHAILVPLAHALLAASAEFSKTVQDVFENVVHLFPEENTSSPLFADMEEYLSNVNSTYSAFCNLEDVLKMPLEPTRQNEYCGDEPKLIASIARDFLVAVRILYASAKKNIADIEHMFGLMCPMASQEIQAHLTSMSEPEGLDPRFHSSSEFLKPPLWHCIRTYLHWQFDEAMESILRLFFPPEEHAKYRISLNGKNNASKDGGRRLPTFDKTTNSEKPFDSKAFFLEDDFLSDESEHSIDADPVNLNILVNIFKEELKSDAAPLSADSLIDLELTFWTKKFSASLMSFHKEFFARELPQKSFAWARMLPNDEKVNDWMQLSIHKRVIEDRDELVILQVEREKRAIFSIFSRVLSEKPPTEDITYEIPCGPLSMLFTVDSFDDYTQRFISIRIINVSDAALCENGVVALIDFELPDVEPNKLKRPCFIDIVSRDLAFSKDAHLDDSLVLFSVNTNHSRSACFVLENGMRCLISDCLGLAKGVVSKEAFKSSVSVTEEETTIDLQSSLEDNAITSNSGSPIRDIPRIEQYTSASSSDSEY